MLSKYIVSMHYGVIFRPEILQIPPLGSVNEHPSRMPAGRGMTPSFWGMLIGDTHNWITSTMSGPSLLRRRRLPVLGRVRRTLSLQGTTKGMGGKSGRRTLVEEVGNEPGKIWTYG
jgi:hypothetical protein